MADAFINYCREDAELAHRIATVLGSQRMSFWSDRQLVPGDDFLESIQAAMMEASCVITIWSPRSIGSEWVQAEADFALRHDKLLPVAIGGEDLPIPFGFRSVQTQFVGLTELPGDEWLHRLVLCVRNFTQRVRKRPRVIDGGPDQTGSVEKPLPRARAKPVAAGRTLPPGEPSRRKAFISYADEDEPLAIELVKYLETAGCPCWISFRDVDPGEDYRLSITNAMDEVAFLVLVYSRHVNTSFDIATELLLARKRQRKRFVLRTDDTDPAGPVEYELATVQWLDCRPDQQAAFERIAQRSALLG